MAAPREISTLSCHHPLFFGTALAFAGPATFETRAMGVSSTESAGPVQLDEDGPMVRGTGLHHARLRGGPARVGQHPVDPLPEDAMGAGHVLAAQPEDLGCH